jgi:glutamate racemase
MTKVGVFDSGIGGLSVVQAVRHELPNVEVLYRSDKEHMPYGDKTPEQMLGFVTPILQNMVAEGCGCIVVACNSVTTNIITQLRERLNVPLIGIEPMVRPAAAMTESKVIAVCATPATLKSARYDWLKETYAKGVRVLEPDCSRWAYMIEQNAVNEQQVKAEIDEVCGQGADVIVLGCTHYHWIEDLIRELTGGRASVIQPEQSVIKRLKTVLAEYHL